MIWLVFNSYTLIYNLNCCALLRDGTRCQGRRHGSVYEAITHLTINQLVHQSHRGGATPSRLLEVCVEFQQARHIQQYVLYVLIVYWCVGLTHWQWLTNTDWAGNNPTSMRNIWHQPECLKGQYKTCRMCSNVFSAKMNVWCWQMKLPKPLIVMASYVSMAC